MYDRPKDLTFDSSHHDNRLGATTLAADLDKVPLRRRLPVVERFSASGLERCEVIVILLCRCYTVRTDKLFFISDRC